MKRISISIIAALIAVASVPAFAVVDQQAASASLITTNTSATVLPIAGTIKSIYFDIPATKTGALSVVSSDIGTVLSVSGVTSDTLYLPRAPINTTAGAIATNGTSAIYDAITILGDVTVTFTPAANTTGTNSFSVKINYEK